MTSTPPWPRTWSSGPGSGGPALVKCVEDEIGARDLERAWRRVRPHDAEVGPDHHESAPRDAVVVDPQAVPARDLALGVEVREQRDGDAQVLLERLVRPGG